MQRVFAHPNAKKQGILLRWVMIKFIEFTRENFLQYLFWYAMLPCGNESVLDNSMQAYKIMFERSPGGLPTGSTANTYW